MLRALFAERQILQRVERGDVRCDPEYKTPLGNTMKRLWPPRTMSRMITYRDTTTGQRLCQTHHFECTHGVALASGFPDPKIFWETEETLVADSGHFDGDVCSPQCVQDRRTTEEARRGALSQYRQACPLCEAWLAERGR